MKTIILCGGRGWRMHEETEFKPKAMVEIGGVPILVHIMGMYAHFGHKDFVLALGYKGELIREFFLNMRVYNNDVEIDLATNNVRMLRDRLVLDYKISFIDTGIAADTADRVLRASAYVDDDIFMVSYGDDVSDVHIGNLVDFHQNMTSQYGVLATITAAHPSSHFGQIRADARNVIQRFSEKPMQEEYVNGGFMVFHKQALQYLRQGETLEDGLERMATAGVLAQYRHEGFWHAMNTMKDVHYLNQIWESNPPWVYDRKTAQVPH